MSKKASRKVPEKSRFLQHLSNGSIRSGRTRAIHAFDDIYLIQLSSGGTEGRGRPLCLGKAKWRMN